MRPFQFLLSGVAALLLAGGCSSSGGNADSGFDDASSDAGQVACGDKTCAKGQVCCIDCDGKGSCGAPGTPCPGLACPPLVDGGTGTKCGDKTCGTGQVCCIDCDGKGSCGAPGTACPGLACPPIADAGVECGDKGQGCCQSGDPCGADLTCCSGVPYPEGGRCEEVCDRKSDRGAKENFSTVSAERVLEKLATLSVSSWNYVGSKRTVRHIGPMAQDFRAVFGLDAGDRHINLGDANGVVMLAIQALHRRVEELSKDNAALRRQVSALQRCLPGPGSGSLAP